MIVRHYNRTGRTSQRKALNPDAELNANLQARDAARSEREVRTALRGIGVVTPPRKVKYRRPRHVRRNQGYYAKNGAFIAFEPAPYFELMKDVGTPRSRKAREARQTTATTVKHNDVALMARMGTIHDPNDQ